VYTYGLFVTSRRGMNYRGGVGGSMYRRCTGRSLYIRRVTDRIQATDLRAEGFQVHIIAWLWVDGQSHLWKEARGMGKGDPLRLVRDQELSIREPLL
jgi:hypothetical protein